MNAPHTPRGGASEPIAVTGLGVVSPFGLGVERFWSGLVAGRPTFAPVCGFDTTGMRRHCAAEVPDLCYQALAEDRGWPTDLGRTSQLGLVAADGALTDARLSADTYEPRRIAVIGGSTVGEARVGETLIPRWRRAGLDAVTAREFAQLTPIAATAVIASHFGFRGPNLVMLTSCTSGNYAIAYGCDLIRQGRVDAALVGGADALSMMTYVGFHRLMSLAPERCQPFDKNRQGIVLGEGAAFLVLERGAAARRRGAAIHGELLGHGMGFDAHHMTAPHPEARGGEQAVRAALAAADLEPDDIDYINAHGTGTASNDRVETVLVRRIFGARAHRMPVSSIKSMIGHTMGAASALEAVACLLALRDGIVPPTAGYDTPDPDCDLDYVPNVARRHAMRIALSQAFAFGGHGSALVLRGVPPAEPQRADMREEARPDGP